MIHHKSGSWLVTSTIQLFAAVLCAYNVVTLFRQRSFAKANFRIRARWSQVFAHATITSILCAFCYRLLSTMTWHDTPFDRFRIASDVLHSFSLLAYLLFAQRFEIQLGPRLHTLFYWICNFVSFAVQSYVIFEAGNHAAHDIAAATYICFFLSCAMMIWESARPRAPGYAAGGPVDDIVQFSKMESEATPREKASIFSLIRFNWVWEFLVYGKSHILMQENYPPLVRDARTYVVHQEFETLWYEESSKEHPSLSWTLLRLVRKELILSGMLSFCARILLKISMPVLLYYFIRFLEDRMADPTLPMLPGFLLAGAFALSQMAEVTAWNFGNFIVRDAAIKIQSALVNSIHRSIFSKTKASGEVRSSGDVINLISSDIERVDNFLEGGMSGFHEFWLVPGVLAVYLVMLYQLLGFFAFIPIVLFVSMMVISKLWGRVVSRIQTRANSGRGQRSKLELDVLRSMRTVKMASWEEAFKEKLIAVSIKIMLLARLLTH
jgi:hypothetical protein